jgi:hypothetical protein
VLDLVLVAAGVTGGHRARLPRRLGLSYVLREARAIPIGFLSRCQRERATTKRSEARRSRIFFAEHAGAPANLDGAA